MHSVDLGKFCLGNRTARKLPAGQSSVSRAFKDRYGGQLALPGGHVEAGESWAEAARREVLEEVGVEADLGGCLGVFPTSLGHNVAAFAGTFSGARPLRFLGRRVVFRQESSKTEIQRS